MSPLVQTSRDKRFLIIPVPVSEEIIENQTDDVTAVVAASDNQTALLARQIRDKVSRAFEGLELRFRNIQIAKKKLLQTAKILCNVLEEPVKTYMRYRDLRVYRTFSFALISDNMIQNNWVSLPRLEYITEETKYSSISQSAYSAGI